MKFYNKLILILLIFFTGNLFAQFNPFKESTERVFSDKEKFVRKHNPSDFKIYSLNLKNVLEWAKKAPELSERPSDLVITLPDANGQLTNYWVYNNAAMENELAENVQNIRSLKAVDTKNNGNSVSISISDIFGLHAMGMKTDGSVFYMDNYTNDLNNVIVYQRNLLELPKNNFTCLVPGDSFDDAITTLETPVQTLSLDNKRRTYRLALACTIEYATFHVNNAPVGTPNTTVNQKKDIVLAAMNVTLTRLNQIFECELNVHLNLISNNRDIIFITSDNFSNDDDFLLIDESQTVIDNVIGSANYDMGHTFSTGGGGLASLGSVCSSWSKASGITGSPSPVGDPYDVDYVAHEMGHQFGANHTQNNSCQRNSSTSVETGSGSTIMSYAGICAPDVQGNADAYYHYVSIREMQTFLLSATCAQQTTVTNSPPVVTALTAKTIPYGTPFILSTAATDPNTADQLTYTFEQVNNQTATQPPVATSTTGPAFRSVAPSTNNFRSFPNISTVLDGTSNSNGIVSNNWERLATVGRTYSFVATVRDNNATGARVVYTQPVTITTANTGPFVITAPNNNPITTEPIWFMGSTKTITWNVAGTTANNINTTDVNILVSTDNGLTYNLLPESPVPNNGSATITVPTNLTSTYDARIKIEAVGNIFYTVSKKFTLWDPNLSTEKVTLDNLKIYPNPTTNILNIEFSTTDIEKVKFDIFDLNGRLIKTVSQENSNQINQQINVESLQTGTYILVINTGKYTSTHKFVKK